MGVLVIMYAHESWTIKRAECWRIDAFELWCWRRLLRVPWTARRSNQSILKEINPEYSLEGVMLKLQYFGHLMWRTDSLEKTLMLDKTGGQRRRGWQKMNKMVGWHHQLHGHEFEQALGDGEGQQSLACCSPWGRKELDMTERLKNSNNIWYLAFRRSESERKGRTFKKTKTVSYINTVSQSGFPSIK